MMDIQKIRANKIAAAAMTDMIEDAIANRNIELNYGEEVTPVAQYIAGWLVSNGYTK